jgi:hypothetical protein
MDTTAGNPGNLNVLPTVTAMVVVIPQNPVIRRFGDMRSRACLRPLLEAARSVRHRRSSAGFYHFATDS